MDSRARGRFRRIFRLVPILMAGALAMAVMQPAPEVRIRSSAWFPPGLVIKAEANLVELGATVRDRNGRPVAGLKAGDFEVLDDNHPREITIFAEQHAAVRGAIAAVQPSGAPVASAPGSPSPRSIALFFDDAHASAMGLRKSVEAAERFVSSGLYSGDRVAVFSASGTVGVDFTTDWKRIPPALAHLRPHPPEGPKAGVTCPTLSVYQAYVIARHLDMMAKQVAVSEAVSCNCPDPTPECVRAQELYVQDFASTTWEQSRYESTGSLDALSIVIRHVASAPGKRLLILLSPGFLTGGMEEQTSALLDVALRANITVSGLNSEGLEAAAMGASPRDRWSDRAMGQRELILSQVLADSAAATGGRFVHNTNDLAAGLTEVAAVPEVSYLLGFTPNGKPDGRYHVLKTRLRADTGYKVESRAGYFSAGFTRENETAQERIDRVAMAETALEDFPATLQVRQESGAEGQAVGVRVSVDASRLKFPVKSGRHVEELTFLAVLADAQGNFIAGKQSVMGLALLPATVARLRKNGIQTITSFAVPPGAYRVREVVREAVENHIWASAATIEVK